MILLASAGLAHGAFWWVGPVVLGLVVFGPPLIYAAILARSDS